MSVSSVVKFRITCARIGIAGISDVEDHTGFWPFSCPISFYVGITCDAITADDDAVLEYRGGTHIAFSRYTPARPHPLPHAKAEPGTAAHAAPRASSCVS
jgi:hypothetical protein